MRHNEAANRRLATKNVLMLNKSKIISFLATTNAKKARSFFEETLGLTFVSADQFALVFIADRTMLRIQIVENVDLIDILPLDGKSKT